MQPLLSFLGSHPALVVQWAVMLVSFVVALLPSRWRESPGVGLLVRVLGRLSVLEHSDAPGTLKWPGVEAAVREAVVAEVARVPTAGLLVLMLAGLALAGPIGCGGALRDNVVAVSNVATRAANAAAGPVLSTYCSQSMAALGRTGVYTAGVCEASGDRGGTPATDAEQVALTAVRARWRPLLGVWDQLVIAQAALVSALDASDATALPARLAALVEVYGRIVELARGFGLSLPGVSL